MSWLFARLFDVFIITTSDFTSLAFFSGSCVLGLSLHPLHSRQRKQSTEALQILFSVSRDSHCEATHQSSTVVFSDPGRHHHYGGCILQSLALALELASHSSFSILVSSSSRVVYSTRRRCVAIRRAETHSHVCKGGDVHAWSVAGPTLFPPLPTSSVRRSSPPRTARALGDSTRDPHFIDRLYDRRLLALIALIRVRRLSHVRRPRRTAALLLHASLAC